MLSSVFERIANNPELEESILKQGMLVKSADNAAVERFFTVMMADTE